MRLACASGVWSGSLRRRPAAGLANWLRVRRDSELAADPASRLAPPPAPQDGTDDNGHRIYLDPWEGELNEYHGPKDRPTGPSSLP
jgi:hypothetical protein